MGVEDGRRIAEGGGDLAFVLPFGHEHGSAGVTEDILGPRFEAELGPIRARARRRVWRGMGRMALSAFALVSHLTAGPGLFICGRLRSITTRSTRPH
jgi:hypothetical protein